MAVYIDTWEDFESESRDSLDLALEALREDRDDPLGYGEDAIGIVEDAIRELKTALQHAEFVRDDIYRLLSDAQEDADERTCNGCGAYVPPGTEFCPDCWAEAAKGA